MTVSERIRSRQLSVGSWIQIGHPAIAELLSDLDFDWVAVDMEHTDIGVREFSNLARGMQGRTPLPFARVSENDTLAIRLVLDAGAMGVFVPLINNAEEARAAVAASRFPPEGIRGFAYHRANRYGEAFEDYVEQAKAISVIVMIESREGVENVSDILAVDGVDAVFIGPYDLSGSYGVTGQTDHPTIIEARQQVVSAAKSAGKSAGLHVVVPTSEAISSAVKQGFNLVALGMDDVFVTRGAKEALKLWNGATGSASKQSR